MEDCFSRGPSPSGRGCREAAGGGQRLTLIRPFGPPSPKGRRIRTILSPHSGQLCKGGEVFTCCASASTVGNSEFDFHVDLDVSFHRSLLPIARSPLSSAVRAMPQREQHGQCAVTRNSSRDVLAIHSRRS